MRRTLCSLATACCLVTATSGATPDPVRIRLGLDSRRTEASAVFGPTGNLYVAYRRSDRGSQSSAVILRLLDGKTGRELARSEFATPLIQLPQRAEAFQLSPDGARLLYFETREVLGPQNETYLAAIERDKLTLLSGRTLERRALPHAQTFGFSSDSASIILGSAEESYVEGGTFPGARHVATRELRITELAAHDLGVTRKELIVQNPFDSYFYLIDATGAPWFSKEAGFFPRSLYKYDPEEKRVLNVIRVDGTLEIGRSHNLFLTHGFLSFTDEPEHAFGQGFLFDSQSEMPTHTARVNGCGFWGAVLSSDEAFAAAVCKATSGAESNFGATTVCRLEVFRVERLQNVATIPCSSKRMALHPVALWHGTGQVRLATVDAAGTVSVYNMSDK